MILTCIPAGKKHGAFNFSIDQKQWNFKRKKGGLVGLFWSEEKKWTKGGIQLGKEVEREVRVQ